MTDRKIPTKFSNGTSKISSQPEEISAEMSKNQCIPKKLSLKLNLLQKSYRSILEILRFKSFIFLKKCTL